MTKIVSKLEIEKTVEIHWTADQTRPIIDNLKNFPKFIGKQPQQSPSQVFANDFGKMFQNIYSVENPQLIVSVKCTSVVVQLKPDISSTWDQWFNH